MAKHIITEYWLCTVCNKKYFNEAQAIECEHLHSLGYRVLCTECNGTGVRSQINTAEEKVVLADCFCDNGWEWGTRETPCKNCGGTGNQGENPEYGKCCVCNGTGLTLRK